MPVNSDLHFKDAFDALSGTVSQPVSQAKNIKSNAEEAEQAVTARRNAGQVLQVTF